VLHAVLADEGTTGIHSWTFTPIGGGVQVDTEESWSGEPVTADVAGMQAALDRSLTAWLDRRRAVTGGPAPHFRAAGAPGR
jgi:hypothetical protein